MKRFTITLSTAIVLFFFSCNDNKTEDKTNTKDTTATATATTDTSAMNNQSMKMPDSATMMKAMMDYATPGSIHAMIAKSNGTWDEDVTWWMDPSKPPVKSKATATNTMILGGRYQESVSKGSMMGQPFEGHGTVGFDNAKKVLVSTWVDNMGTGIMYMEGTWDSTTHTANFKGKMPDPATGKDMDYRETFTMTDDNHQKMEMFSNMGGKEMKTMEIDFTRKK